MPFFSTKCAPFLFKIGEDFNIDGLELMNIVFINHLSTFGSKVFSTLKIMDFESASLTKFVHIYVIEGMNA
jgi:hypothetical protein